MPTVGAVDSCVVPAMFPYRMGLGGGVASFAELDRAARNKNFFSSKEVRGR